MKIIGSDNHNRESVADVLDSEGYPDTPEGKATAEARCKQLNIGLGDGPGTHYHVVPDDQRLSRGMEDLV